MSRKPFEITLDLPNSEGREKHRKRPKKNLSFCVKQTRPLVVDVLQYNGNQMRVPLQPGEEATSSGKHCKNPPTGKNSEKACSSSPTTAAT